MDQTAYSEKLAEIKQLTLEMGHKTVTAVELAAQALLGNNVEIAAQVRSLEKEVDALYKQIDERCIAFFATQQPLGRDLRFLVSTIKIAPEIERIADYANNIAKKVQKKFSREDMTPVESLKPSIDVMAREVSSMLTEAMHCYEAGDADLAMIVHQRDILVNHMNKELFKSIVTMTTRNHNVDELAMDFHTTVRYIERVADRSCNIVESVYYAVTGYRFAEKR